MKGALLKKTLFGLNKFYWGINVCLITFSAANNKKKNTITTNNNRKCRSILTKNLLLSPEYILFIFFIFN